MTRTQRNANLEKSTHQHGNSVSYYPKARGQQEWAAAQSVDSIGELRELSTQLRQWNFSVKKWKEKLQQGKGWRKAIISFHEAHQILQCRDETLCGRDAVSIGSWWVQRRDSVWQRCCVYRLMVGVAIWSFSVTSLRILEGKQMFSINHVFSGVGGRGEAVQMY